MVYGYEGEQPYTTETWPITDEIWYVPYKYYRLTKLIGFGSEEDVCGFIIIYEFPESDGWATESKLFGTTEPDNECIGSEIDLSNIGDIKQVDIIVDDEELGLSLNDDWQEHNEDFMGLVFFNSQGEEI